MTDYIKREDALKELLGCVPTDVHEIEDLDVIRVMLALPSADVAPVRHGRWVESFKVNAPPTLKSRWICSWCGNVQTYGATDYCPNCGAKMDGERKDNA